MLYDAFFSDQFRNHLEKLTKRNTVLKKRILAKVKDMRNDPLGNSNELGGDFKGKRRIRVGDYRLIYAPCDDCRKKGYERFNNCYGCDSMPSNAIVYFDVLHRSSHEYDS